MHPSILSSVGIPLLVALGLATPGHAHGDLHERIAKLTKSIAKAPRAAGLYLQRGELHRLHKDWKAARRDFATARRLSPATAELDLFEGRLEASAGRLVPARKLLDRFLLAHPHHLRGIQCRARLLTRLGERVAALRDFDKVLKLVKAPNPDHYLERTRAQQGFGVDPAVVVRGIDEGVRRLGPLVALLETALEIELQRRDWPAALRRLDSLQRAMPLRSPWLLRRGMVYEKMRRPAAARRSYSEGLAELAGLPRRNKIQEELQRSLRSRLDRLSKSVPPTNSGNARAKRGTEGRRRR